MADLFAAARLCLDATAPDAKIEQVEGLLRGWDAGQVVLGAGGEPRGPVTAGRPPRPHLVSGTQVQRRRLGTPEGRGALIHAVTHIEFNAINLALDAVYRFRAMPSAYYGDWLRVAAEEAHHFRMLREHLRALGYDYGDFDAHNGLWEMAVKTAHDPLVRMALVPRVLEARGLDVTPGMINRLRGAGDHGGAAILEVILAEEVGHVAAGSRWFRWLCQRRGLEPASTFRGLLDEFGGAIKGPLNHPARRVAGFTDRELSELEAMASPPHPS